MKVSGHICCGYNGGVANFFPIGLFISSNFTILTIPNEKVYHQIHLAFLALSYNQV